MRLLLLAVALVALAARADPALVPPLEPVAVEPTHRLRAATEIGSWLAFDWSLLLITPPPAADPPGDVSVLTKLSLKGVTFDVSTFSTNFLLHPMAGNLYYTLARSNRLGALESFGWAVGGSTVWELAEFPECFSINDEIVTPVAGASLGESLFQLASWLDARPHGLGGTLLSWLLAPARRLNGTMDGALGGDPTGTLDGHAALVGGAIRGRDGWQPAFGISLTSRLIRDADYGEAGQGLRARADGGNTELSLEATGAERGVADLRLSARSWIATLYQRDLERSQDGLRGSDWLAGVGPGYELRLHRWDLSRTGTLDTFSVVHVPGAFVELRHFEHALRLSAKVEAALSFGGSRSLALDEVPGALAIDVLPTPARSYGYYFGFGPTLAPSAELALGPATLSLGARFDRLSGIMSRDVWPGRHPTAELADSWGSVSGRFGYRLPWEGLELSASATRSLRWGRAGDTERTLGQTAVSFGLGFAN